MVKPRKAEVVLGRVAFGSQSRRHVERTGENREVMAVHGGGERDLEQRQRNTCSRDAPASDKTATGLDRFGGLCALGLRIGVDPVLVGAEGAHHRRDGESERTVSNRWVVVYMLAAILRLWTVGTGSVRTRGQSRGTTVGTDSIRRMPTIHPCLRTCSKAYPLSCNSDTTAAGK